MPQMNPMNWILILNLSLLSYWSLFSSIHFFKYKNQFKPISTKSNIFLNNNNFAIMW